MADETSTTNSEATTETVATTAETAATETVANATKENNEAALKDEGDLGTTALGGGEEAIEAKAEATEEAKVEVPETYELAVPEGFEKLDEASVAAATPVFKELGLSNEQANKLVPIAADMAKRIVADRDQALMGTILEQRKSWLNDAKADKDIGGANWDNSLRDAARFMDTLGAGKGSPLRVALDESGFGNHPELIRLFAKAGKLISEDNDFVRGDANAAVTKKSDAELFWGKKDQG